jgi:hypothetical protein
VFKELKVRKVQQVHRVFKELKVRKVQQGHR